VRKSVGAKAGREGGETIFRRNKPCATDEHPVSLSTGMITTSNQQNIVLVDALSAIEGHHFAGVR
jgi:hypothetical protein